MTQLLEITCKGEKRNVAEMIILGYVNKNFPQVLLDMIFEYIHISWYKLYTGNLLNTGNPYNIIYFRSDKWTINIISTMKLISEDEKIKQYNNIINIKDNRTVQDDWWSRPYLKTVKDEYIINLIKDRIRRRRMIFDLSTNHIKRHLAAKIIPKHLYLVKKYDYLGLVGYELENELQIYKDKWKKGLVPLYKICGEDLHVIDV